MISFEPNSQLMACPNVTANLLNCPTTIHQPFSVQADASRTGVLVSTVKEIDGSHPDCEVALAGIHDLDFEELIVKRGLSEDRVVGVSAAWVYYYCSVCCAEVAVRLNINFWNYVLYMLFWYLLRFADFR